MRIYGVKMKLYGGNEDIWRECSRAEYKNVRDKIKI